MESEELTFSDLLSLVRRRFAVFANSFIALLSISVLLAFGLPSVYESTGTILIEQQAFAKHHLNYVIDTYLPTKLRHPERFLP